MSRRKTPGRSARPEPIDEMPNGYRLFQVAEDDSLMVSTRRELLANEIADLLLDSGEEVETFAQIPLGSGGVAGSPTFYVRAKCSLEQMQQAIRLALYDVIQFDAALVQLNLWEIPT